MICIIEGISWKWNAASRAKDLESFESALDLLDEAILYSRVLYSAELFNTPIVENLTYFDLFKEETPFEIPWTIKERVTSIFLRLERWEDTDLWPADMDVLIAGMQKDFLPSIACAATIKCLDDSKLVGVIHFSSVFPSGLAKLEIILGICGVFFMQCYSDWIAFNRYAIIKSTRNSSDLIRYANRAFPNLRFVDGALHGIHNMSRPYHSVIEDVLNHLSVISDNGASIFAERQQEIPALFGSLGVNISDENGATKSNRQAKKERTRKLGDEEITFWWHSKIQRHRDRIHLYFDTKNGQVRMVIGILCSHLTV